MSRGRSRKESQRGGAYLSGLWSCVTSVNGEAEVSRSEKVEVLGSPRFLTVLSVSYLNRISFQSQSVSISFSKLDFFFFFALHSRWDLSSPTRDQTQVPTVKLWSHTAWTSREFPERWNLRKFRHLRSRKNLSFSQAKYLFGCLQGQFVLSV